ncbi:MAG: hypothetical protein ACRENE_20950 [Polyangiaceae bacterium]
MGVCADPSLGWAQVSAGHCAGYAALAYNWQTHWQLCTYDDADGGALVGALVEADDNAFCDGTDYLLRAGQVSSMSCDPYRLTAVASCPPGNPGSVGTDAGDAHATSASEPTR